MGRKKTRAKRTFRYIAGSLLFLIGSAGLIGGGLLMYLNITVPADDGFTMSNAQSVRSGSNCYFQGFISSTSTITWSEKKWVVRSLKEDNDLFVGWAWSKDIGTYTTGHPFEAPENWRWDYHPYKATITVSHTRTFNNGTAPPPNPSNETFWIDSIVVKGGETGTIPWQGKWDPAVENRVLVIMNEDSSAGIDAEIRFGARIGVLTWLPYPLMVLGLIFDAFSIALVAGALRR